MGMILNHSKQYLFKSCTKNNKKIERQLHIIVISVQDRYLHYRIFKGELYNKSDEIFTPRNCEFVANEVWQ